MLHAFAGASSYLFLSYAAILAGVGLQLVSTFNVEFATQQARSAILSYNLYLLIYTLYLLL